MMKFKFNPLVKYVFYPVKSIYAFCLAIVLLNRLFQFFVHLTLEFLAQFPALNDEKHHVYLSNITSQIEWLY